MQSLSTTLACRHYTNTCIVNSKNNIMEILTDFILSDYKRSVETLSFYKLFKLY